MALNNTQRPCHPLPPTNYKKLTKTYSTTKVSKTHSRHQLDTRPVLEKHPARQEPCIRPAATTAAPLLLLPLSHCCTLLHNHACRGQQQCLNHLLATLKPEKTDGNALPPKRMATGHCRDHEACCTCWGSALPRTRGNAAKALKGPVTAKLVK
jgi:hypothetical protein